MSFRTKRKKKNRPVSDPSLSAVVAAQRAKNEGPRKDVKPAMLKLVPISWNWSEQTALSVGTAEEGYYMVPECSGVRMISPEAAEELFCYHNYGNQRNFKPANAERLSDVMKVAVNISICIGPDNYPVIVNGQHTLWAIYLRGQTVQANVSVYMCRDEKAIGRNFGIYDSNSVRTAAQVVEARKKTGDIDIDIPSARLHRYAQWFACAKNDFNPPKRLVTNQAKADAAANPEVIRFAKWIETHIESTTKLQGLLPLGIGACVVAAFSSDAPRAEVFLKKYLSGIFESRHDPIKILYDRMTINKPVAEHGGNASRLHSEICYTCWRKFCIKEDLRATRRTYHIPDWQDWKVYQAPHAIDSDSFDSLD